MPHTLTDVRRWLADLSAGELALDEDNQGLARSTLEFLENMVDPAVPQETLKPGYLTPHFTLAEMVRSDTALARGISNEPTAEEVASITRTCETLEKIRVLLGNNPITITSGFRSEALNRAVGGAVNSAHRLGLAADFVCPSFGKPKAIAELILGLIGPLGLDQVIYENTGGGQWVHIGLTKGVPRHMALTITDAGTVSGIV